MLLYDVLVLVINTCIGFLLLLYTYHHKLSGLTRHKFISEFRSCQKSGWVQLVLSLRSHEAKVKVLAALDSYLEALGENLLHAHSGCWQNSVPCSYGTEVISSPAGWGCSQLLEVACIPFIFKAR